jgi:TPR repeat protein
MEDSNVFASALLDFKQGHSRKSLYADAILKDTDSLQKLLGSSLTASSLADIDRLYVIYTALVNTLTNSESIKPSYQEHDLAILANSRARHNAGTISDVKLKYQSDLEETFSSSRSPTDHANVDTLYNLGIWYDNGQCVTQDHAQAAIWYSRAAEQGHAGAQALLGYLFANGQGVAQDYAQAASLYQKSAAQGNADAQFNLGFLYANGQGVTQDYAQAAAWYRKAAEQGNVRAQLNLGILYSNGQGVTQDYKEAASLYNRAATLGYSQAKAALGLLCQGGRELGLDLTTATSCYRAAAEQGDAGAQSKIGSMYTNGQGVAQDDTQAALWYRKAADQNDVAGEYELGYAYYNGKGVPQDTTQAIFWYSKAAEQGHAEARANLYKIGTLQAVLNYREQCDKGRARACTDVGQIFSQWNCRSPHIDVPRNMDESVRYFRKGCSAGDARGCTFLGLSYHDGLVKPPDWKKDDYLAHTFLGRGCNGGDLGACTILAHMYVRGDEFPRDPIRGFTMFQTSCNGGDAEACKTLANYYDSGLPNFLSRDHARARALNERAETLGGDWNCNPRGSTALVRDPSLLVPAVRQTAPLANIVEVATYQSQEYADTMLTMLRSMGFTPIAHSDSPDIRVHIQFGPFPTFEEANEMRQRLLARGYNSVIK